MVRIELQKHFVPHHEIEELEEAEEPDQIMIEDENEQDLSYAQLRDIQKGHIGKSFSKLEQKESVMLIQNLASEE